MNIIFLDIDGVLQPYNSSSRFLINKEQRDRIIEYLSIVNNVDYTKGDIYDVLAAYFDWHQDALKRLQNILNETNSKIIVSSDWRSDKLPYKIRDLLKIHNLDQYWFKDNIRINSLLSYDEIRHLEIQDSLNKYSIDNYVVLDDMKELAKYYPNNSVITHNYLKDDDMNKCIKILKK